jgi:hypothetical protein
VVYFNVVWCAVIHRQCDELCHSRLHYSVQCAYAHLTIRVYACLTICLFIPLFLLYNLDSTAHLRMLVCTLQNLCVEEYHRHTCCSTYHILPLKITEITPYLSFQTFYTTLSFTLFLIFSLSPFLYLYFPIYVTFILFFCGFF